MKIDLEGEESMVPKRIEDQEFPDESVNYDELEQHVYEDSEGHIFYTCPLCGGEYISTFIVEESGETMCIDCWDKEFGSK